MWNRNSRAILIASALALSVALDLSLEPGISELTGGIVKSPILRSVETKSFLPEWVQADWEYWTQGNGRWIADNSAYKGENEPFDAYGTEWKWGLGKKSLKGRLFAMKDGKEIGTVWEFHYFWHPKEQRVVLNQFGSDGTYATGTMKLIEGKKPEAVERFWTPEGTTYQVGHRADMRDGEVHMQSYNVTDAGVWEKRRFYIWKNMRN